MAMAGSGKLEGLYSEIYILPLRVFLYLRQSFHRCAQARLLSVLHTVIDKPQRNKKKKTLNQTGLLIARVCTLTSVISIGFARKNKSNRGGRGMQNKASVYQCVVSQRT